MEHIRRFDLTEMMSLEEFNRVAHGKWKGRVYYYDSNLQDDRSSQEPVIQGRFDDVSVGFSQRAVQFHNGSGGMIGLVMVEGVEVVRETPNFQKLTFFTEKCGKKRRVSFLVR